VRRTPLLLSALLAPAIATVCIAEPASARDCAPVTSKRYAPGHSVTFSVGGRISCRFARRSVRRIVANHARWLPDGWVCQTRIGSGGNGECKDLAGRNFYWGVLD